MSLRELAQKHWRNGRPRCPRRDSIGVSQRDKTAQAHILLRIPLSQALSQVGQQIRHVGQSVPLGQCGTGGTTGTVGTDGTIGTGGTRPVPVFDPVRLQREADRRNAAAIRDRITDRWCACGRLATFAYPNSAGRDVWHCLECLDAYGRA